MALQITQTNIGRMIAQARAAMPEECCGILVGRRDGDDVVVATLVPSANVWEGDRKTRFLLDARIHLRVQRECRAAGTEIVGFYHSHPHSPPVPSAFDKEMAWPEHSYIILSLLNEPPQLRSWRLNKDGGAFEEEPVRVDGE